MERPVSGYDDYGYDDEPPFYTRVGCAFAFNEEPDLKEGDPLMHYTAVNGGYVTNDDGWSCDLGFGHRFSESSRADVTLEYRGPYDIDGVPDASVPGSHIQSTSVQSVVTLFNGYWDIERYGSMVPYLGAGIGFAYNNMDRVYQNGTSFTEGGSNFDFAWALMAGASIDVSEDVVLDLGYRYVNFGDAVSGTGASGNTVPRVRADDLGAHELRVGVRYAFY